MGTLQGSDWIEDSEGAFRKLFKVSGYLTLLKKNDGRLAKVLPGDSEELKSVFVCNLAR